jgi:hypothetical protein
MLRSYTSIVVEGLIGIRHKLSPEFFHLLSTHFNFTLWVRREMGSLTLGSKA